MLHVVGLCPDCVLGPAWRSAAQVFARTLRAHNMQLHDMLQQAHRALICLEASCCKKGAVSTWDTLGLGKAQLQKELQRRLILFQHLCHKAVHLEEPNPIAHHQNQGFSSNSLPPACTLCYHHLQTALGHHHLTAMSSSMFHERRLLTTHLYLCSMAVLWICQVQVDVSDHCSDMVPW
jgi:hypothetical protein